MQDLGSQYDAVNVKAVEYGAADTACLVQAFARFEATTRATQPEAALREAAQAVLDTMSGTYKAGNGREMGIQGDDGEKCWIVHSDQIEDLRAILALQSRERGEGDGGPCAFDGKPCYVGGGTDDAHYRCGTSACPRSATLSPAEPSPESREGWQPIETLTKGDGYVLGWSGRSDDCGEREYFMGRLYDIRPGALLNEWTGRWRGATHWRPLPSPPASAIRALSAPAHD
jgi:hypothetical protein